MSDSIRATDLRDADEPITALTCFDYLTARVMDQVEELDLILVGDSLGNVVQGEDDTLSVTVDDMVYHTRSVAAGVERAFLVRDIPFLEMARSLDHLVETVQRLMGEAGAQAVKVEGGQRNADAVEHITDHDVPVVGHLGLTPQSVEAFGGYQVRGTTPSEIRNLGRDARALEDAGAIALVLECVPAPVAGELTDRLSIPTIGIGAGPGCDGQVLVWQDMMGLSDGPAPSFVRQWEQMGEALRDGVREYCHDVRSGDFPADEESFGLPGDTSVEQVRNWLDET
jgi:3-methyl-2-oxobutanoate hydroxymethyltransferase